MKKNRKISTFVKIYENLDFSQSFRKISILIEILEYLDISKNFS